MQTTSFVHLRQSTSEMLSPNPYQTASIKASAHQYMLSPDSTSLTLHAVPRRLVGVCPSDYVSHAVGLDDKVTATPSTTGGGTTSPNAASDQRILQASNHPSPSIDQLINNGGSPGASFGAHLHDSAGMLTPTSRPLQQQQQVVDLRRQLCDQNLFIFHLPSDWREAELKELFVSFGTILSAKVVKRPDGSSKGYGFVCFEHQQDALVAAAQMNGFSVSGKRLKVSLKKTPEECLNLQVKKLLEMAEQNEVFDRDRDCSLFVFHLPPHWDDKDLRSKFTPFGPVIAAKVSRKEDGTSRGYGFVTCSDPRAAAMAILNLNGLEVCNKRLKVQPKQLGSGSHPRPDCTIFVFHLPNDWTDAILRQFFSNCGRVVSATVQRDPKGRSRGFGFVTFDRAQSARDAVNEMNGVSVGIKRLKVSLKRATGGGRFNSMGPSSQQWSSRLEEAGATDFTQQEDSEGSWTGHQAQQSRVDQHQQTAGIEAYADSFYPWKAASIDPCITMHDNRMMNAKMSAQRLTLSIPHVPYGTSSHLTENDLATAYAMATTSPGTATSLSNPSLHAGVLVSPLLSTAAPDSKQFHHQAVFGGGGESVQSSRPIQLTPGSAAPTPHLLAYSPFQQRSFWNLASLSPAIPFAATHPSLRPSANGRYAPHYFARPNAVPCRRSVRSAGGGA